MATIRKRKGKWEVRIRRFGNKTMSRTFIECRDAEKWAREYEAKLEKGLFEDLSHANAITLKEVLQQYCSEVSSTKLGYAEEKYKIKKLCRETIANLKLAKITPLRLKKFQDSWSLSHNPSTVNKYLTLISVAIKHARQMLGIYLPNNPCDFVKRLKEPEFKGDVIDASEEELLLTQAEHSKANCGYCHLSHPIPDSSKTFHAAWIYKLFDNLQNRCLRCQIVDPGKFWRRLTDHSNLGQGYLKLLVRNCT